VLALGPSDKAGSVIGGSPASWAQADRRREEVSPIRYEDSRAQRREVEGECDNEGVGRGGLTCEYRGVFKQSLDDMLIIGQIWSGC